MLSQAYRWAFQSQWSRVTQRDFPPLPPPCTPFSCDGSGIWNTYWRALLRPHFCLVQNASSKETGVRSENSHSSWKQTSSSCSGEPHEGALSPSKHGIPSGQALGASSLRTSPPQRRGLAFLCPRRWVELDSDDSGAPEAHRWLFFLR